MKKFESKSDFKDRIASIAMGISVEQVVLQRGVRLSAAREKWVTKHYGSSHIKRKNHTQYKTESK